MSVTTPQSTIKLYNAPEVISRAGETLIFATAADREAYFASKVVASSVNCTVVKKRYNTIKVKTPMATLEQCNYISFINPSYGNKLFYAYIMSTDYLNNEVSLVTYNIDWWMTDMFNVQFRDDTQMVREHLTNKEKEKLDDSNGRVPYPDVEKMFSQEPLSCDPETENRFFNVAGDCVGYLKSKPAYAATKFEAWNATSNNGKMWPVNGSWDSTDHESTLMAHVLCFTIPGQYDSEEAGRFRINLQELLYDVMEADMGTTPNYFPPFFVYDPTGDTPYSQDLHTGTPQYFIGRHNFAGTSGDVSTSRHPLEDTSYLRPYMMVASPLLDKLQPIINLLNQTGNVSSILGFHEMPVCLFAEFFASCNLGAPSASLPEFNSYRMVIPIPRKSEELNNIIAEDPKLRYFPFSYFTFEGTGNNTRMEMKYELSSSYDGSPRAEGVTIMKGVTVNATGTYFFVRPAGYKGSVADLFETMDPVDYKDGNLDYTMQYGDFPQVPYNTDAYAAFIANKAKELMEQNTKEGLYYDAANYAAAQATNAGGILGVIGSALGGAASAASGNAIGATAGASGVYGAIGNYMGSGYQIDAMNMRAAMKDEAFEALYSSTKDTLWGTEPNAVYENFSKSRGAYVMPNYHPGTVNGLTTLSKGLQRPGIIVRCVRRSDEYIKKYNNFFKRYGYTTKDCKLPAIAKWLDNSSDDNAAYLPIIAGAAHGYSDVFYTQTDSMKVSGVCGDSATFIEHMFDGGVAIRRYVP